MQLSSDDIRAIRRDLLAFYDAQARHLPWRGTADPYAIWVSEVMAQQTRVDTVVPYYDRWLRRFPDVAALANAPLDAVLEAWEGLGYYARARNLHNAARLVRELHDGAVPSSYAELRTLPGVGDYTAGAVASIAFGERQPAVDGNVRRVLSRLLDEPDPSATRLRAVAAELVPADRPGDFNQGLMELGATLCTPASPACEACPLSPHCASRRLGTQRDRPRRAAKKPIPSFDVATAVIHRADGRVLVQRRPATGLLAGLWSFPGSELSDGADAMTRAVQVARSVCPHSSDEGVPIGCIEHTFSHRRERYICYMIASSTRGPAGADLAWIDSDRSGIALPRAQQRVLALAAAALQPDVHRIGTTG